ncbi:hypothetical protein ANCDUO_12498, partial [Ancylostoma duodenale]
MLQARKIRHDVIGLTEKERHWLLNATFDTREELFFRTCDSRGNTGFWKDAVVDNINEEDDRLAYHLRDSAESADCSRATKKRLSYETFELICQRGGARAAGDYQLTSELAKRCREAIKEDLKERRAAVLAEAAEAGKSIRNARRDFANRKTKMSAPRDR